LLWKINLHVHVDNILAVEPQGDRAGSGAGKGFRSRSGVPRARFARIEVATTASEAKAAGISSSMTK
jgi:hypothetical protein